MWQDVCGVSHLKASDLHRYDSAYFVLCCCVVLLTELHDVQTLHASITSCLVWSKDLEKGGLLRSAAAYTYAQQHAGCVSSTFEPSAGPTGGAGLALPAWSASLMYPTTAQTDTGVGVTSCDVGDRLS